MLRVYSAFLLFATGVASIAIATANAPGQCNLTSAAEGGSEGCIRPGLSEGLYFTMLVVGAILAVVGFAALYGALLRQSDRLD